MININVSKLDDGSIYPSETYPTDTILVVVGGDYYTCYQVGDSIPDSEQSVIEGSS